MDNSTKPIEGAYANYFEVSYSAHEFLLDFGQFDHTSGVGNILTRIITTPVGAEKFSGMLHEAVERYGIDVLQQGRERDEE